MPIYEYRCPECQEIEEVVRLISERDTPKLHSCGVLMERIISLPQPPIIVESGNEHAYKVLNREDGLGFPDNQHRKRYEKHFAQGLNREKSVIGVGF